MDDKKRIAELEYQIKAYQERLTEFIESAAHDLNAPLRKLAVFIDRLIAKNESGFDADAKEYVRRIQSSINEMKSLIDGLTTLANVHDDSKLVDCDLMAIARETIESFEEEIAGKNISVTVGDLPVVRGTDFQYRQLLRNLFENSIKFSRSDVPLRIDVKSEFLTAPEKKRFHLDDNKKYFRIEIKDNGIGFNQEYAERIFQPFVRLHPRSKYAGNGLGLAICKRIVTNHKGIIHAEGDENHGSRFALILPETP